MQTESFLKSKLYCLNFEKFTSIFYKGEFLKVNARQPNFQKLLCVHSLRPL